MLGIISALMATNYIPRRNIYDHYEEHGSFLWSGPGDMLEMLKMTRRLDFW